VIDGAEVKEKLKKRKNRKLWPPGLSWEDGMADSLTLVETQL